MTIDKDFKKLVRARMAKTGESYTAARAALLNENGESSVKPRHEFVDTTVYTEAIDGRIAAEEPDVPGVIGYGPSRRYASIEQSRRASSKRFPQLFGSAHDPIVVRKIRDRNGRWTAYMSDDPLTVGEGETRWSALDALEQKMPPKLRDRYSRTVLLEEHDDGRWSAQSEGADSCGAMTWGATRNEAEEKLMDEEETEAFMNDSVEDYGSDRD